MIIVVIAVTVYYIVDRKQINSSRHQGHPDGVVIVKPPDVTAQKSGAGTWVPRGQH